MPNKRLKRHLSADGRTPVPGDRPTQRASAIDILNEFYDAHRDEMWQEMLRDVERFVKFARRLERRR